MKRIEMLAECYADRHGGDEKEEAAYIAGYLKARDDMVLLFQDLVRKGCPEARFPYLQFKLRQLSEEEIEERRKTMQEIIREAHERAKRLERDF